MKENNQAIRILPLGDSITYDNDIADCTNPRPIGDRIAYRFELYRLLKQAEYNFAFVGNRQAGGNYFKETNNAGFPGCTAKQLCELIKTGYNGHDDTYEVKGNYLEIFKPDLILLHIGSNYPDKTNPVEIDEILEVIQEYQKSKNGNPVTTFLARIINQSPHNPVITKLNKEVDKLVRQRVSRGELIIQVDMENTLDYNKDMADWIHPNPVGYKKMAVKWFEALDTWLKITL